MFYFRLTIKGLSKYKNSIEPVEITRNTVKAYGIEWFFFDNRTIIRKWF